MTGETAAIVITSCGKRKSIEPSAALHARQLQRGDVVTVARDWASQVGQADRRVPARSLYQGRAFREAERAAAPLAAQVYVISAGLGLIGADRAIPSYSLTVANGADNILTRLDAKGAEAPSLWWQEMNRAAGTQSFAQVLAAETGPILLAAGGTYLGMIAPELASLDRHQLSRLRLFTASPAQSLPPALRPFLMPYDRRLEAVAGCSGTVADFAQRALRHFAETIFPSNPAASASVQSAAVLASLESHEAPEKKRGKSMSDSQIAMLIADHWEQVQGKSGAMLRLLRDSFDVACEQGRFKKLFAQVREERSL